MHAKVRMPKDWFVLHCQSIECCFRLYRGRESSSSLRHQNLSCSSLVVDVLSVTDVEALSACNCMGMWPSCSLPARMRKRLCAWAESTVGKVDRRGQQNALFVTLVGLANGIEAYWSQCFDDFDRFIVLTCRSDTYISRSGDFRADRQNCKTRLLYPLRMRAG